MNYISQITLDNGTVTNIVVSNLDEAVGDLVNTLLVAGTNITLTYNDGAHTLTIDAAGGGGGVTDGDKGDITVSGSGATWTIDQAAVTYAKMQDTQDGVVLGRRVGGGPGDVEELLLAGNITTAGGNILNYSGITTLQQGGTGNTLTGPGADRIFFFDQSGGTADWLIVGSGLLITNQTITVDINGMTATDIALTDEVPFADASDSGNNKNVTIERLLGFSNRATCQGRLTTETGVPVSTTDQTAKTSIYFALFGGNLVSLYDGTRWNLYTFAELTLALGTLTTLRPYDVFLYDNAGTLTLEALAWTSDTARATALVLQDGVWCKSGALTRRYLGTFRTTSTTTTEDSAAKRFVWNAQNRVRRQVLKQDTTASWVYTTATIRQTRASTANQIEVVNGDLGSSMVDLIFAQASNNSSNAQRRNGIGEDSITAFAPDSIVPATGGILVLTGIANLRKHVPLGYHYYAMLEWSEAVGSATYFGLSTHQLCGLTGFYDC